MRYWYYYLHNTRSQSQFPILVVDTPVYCSTIKREDWQVRVLGHIPVTVYSGELYCMDASYSFKKKPIRDQE